jgi:hypothetical protein
VRLPSHTCCRSLVGHSNGGKNGAAPTIPAEIITPEGSRPDLAVSMQPKEVEQSGHSSMSTASAQTSVEGGVEGSGKSLNRPSGTYRVDYQVRTDCTEAEASGWCLAAATRAVLPCACERQRAHLLVVMVILCEPFLPPAEVSHCWVRQAASCTAAVCAAAISRPRDCGCQAQWRCVGRAGGLS